MLPVRSRPPSGVNRGAVVAACLILAGLTGCGYLGSARALDLRRFDEEPGWVAVRDVRFQKQNTLKDCGAASVAMVLSHWGLPATTEEISLSCPGTDKGVKAGELRDLIRKRGLKGFLIRGTFDDLKNELSASRPVIVGLLKPYSNGAYSHYEVVVGINPGERRVATLDPAAGPRLNTFEGFLQEWEPAGTLTIVVIGNERSDFPAGAGSGRGHPPAHTALSPLMAAPESDGQVLFPSGSWRPPIHPPGSQMTYSLVGDQQEDSGVR